MKTLMAKSGIPKRFLSSTIKDFNQKYQIQDSDTGIFLHGPRGTGKTHFLAAVCHQKIHDHLRKNGGEIEDKDLPAFIAVPELLFQIKQSYSKNSNITEAEILKKYSKIKVLILDDIGAERATDWSVPLLYLLINRRYAEMKQTFISSNLDLNQVAKQLDDRISSRIAGMCDVVELSGKDRRV